jgi:hypothetical protein
VARRADQARDAFGDEIADRRRIAGRRARNIAPSCTTSCKRSIRTNARSLSSTTVIIVWINAVLAIALAMFSAMSAVGWMPVYLTSGPLPYG